MAIDHEEIRMSIRIAYFNINAGRTANIYSMVAYSLTPTDEANGQRLRYEGVSATSPARRPFALAIGLLRGSAPHHDPGSQGGDVWATPCPWFADGHSMRTVHALRRKE